MSISFMTASGPIKVPVDVGGVNLDLLNKLSNIENQIDDLKKHATTQEFGLSKISSATDVTEQDSGLVLSAVQNNPTVDGSIRNELEKIKQNTYSLKTGTFLKSGDDLNTYRTPGNYYCNDISIVNSLLNCPVKGVLFSMKVEWSAGDVYFPYQTLRAFHSGYIYYRYFSSVSWDTWKVIKTEAIT